MDINHTTKFKLMTNTTSWDLDMEENTILHDQIHSINPLWQNYPPHLQSNQRPVLATSSSPSPHLLLPSSSSTSIFESNSDRVEEVQDQEEEDPEEELGAMKEMMYKIAAMQPVDIDPATIRKPKRRNVRISDDPQSVAARHRRERISEKIRILQRLVPGGTKMDTASMLDESIHYVKFLKRQIKLLQSNDSQNNIHPQCLNIGVTKGYSSSSSGNNLGSAFGNWAFAPNKAHVSSSMNNYTPKTPTVPSIIPGFNIGGNRSSINDMNMGFNHEVIGD